MKCCIGLEKMKAHPLSVAAGNYNVRFQITENCFARYFNVQTSFPKITKYNMGDFKSNLPVMEMTDPSILQITESSQNDYVDYKLFSVVKK